MITETDAFRYRQPSEGTCTYPIQHLLPVPSWLINPCKLRRRRQYVRWVMSVYKPLRLAHVSLRQSCHSRTLSWYRSDDNASQVAHWEQKAPWCLCASRQSKTPPRSRSPYAAKNLAPPNVPWAFLLFPLRAISFWIPNACPQCFLLSGVGRALKYGSQPVTWTHPRRRTSNALQLRFQELYWAIAAPRYLLRNRTRCLPPACVPACVEDSQPVAFCLFIELALAINVRFSRSTTPFCSGVYGMDEWLISCDDRKLSNWIDLYSPPLSDRNTFWPVPLSASTANFVNSSGTSLFLFRNLTTQNRLRLSMKVRKYLAPPSDWTSKGPQTSLWTNPSNFSAREKLIANGSLCCLPATQPPHSNFGTNTFSIPSIAASKTALRKVWTFKWPNRRCHSSTDCCDNATRASPPLKFNVNNPPGSSLHTQPLRPSWWSTCSPQRTPLRLVETLPTHWANFFPASAPAARCVVLSCDLEPVRTPLTTDSATTDSAHPDAIFADPCGFGTSSTLQTCAPMANNFGVALFAAVNVLAISSLWSMAVTLELPRPAPLCHLGNPHNCTWNWRHSAPLASNYLNNFEGYLILSHNVNRNYQTLIFLQRQSPINVIAKSLSLISSPIWRNSSRKVFSWLICSRILPPASGATEWNCLLSLHLWESEDLAYCFSSAFQALFADFLSMTCSFWDD